MRRVFLPLHALSITLIFGIAFTTACRPAGPAASNGKVGVVGSFYPLYEAARQVGGDKADVASIVPAGSEPHDFEPTPKQIASLTTAKIVVYNGAGLEVWIDRVLPDLQKAGVVTVNASQATQVFQMTDETNPSKTVPDPHIWLDPVIFEHIVAAVKDAYVKVDPANKTYYEANAANYISKLDALDKSFQTGLSGYAKRTIVTSHDAFRYLSRRYGLTSVFIAGLSPDAEPSPQKLAEITKVAKDNGVKYIFFETLVSPKLAQTVAQEVGAQTMVLDPLEGLTSQEIAAGKDYISVMQQNMANLKTALGAQQ